MRRKKKEEEDIIRRRGRDVSYQRSERVVQPEIQRQRLDQFEKERMIKLDRVGRDVFLHSVFASTIRV